MLTMIMRPGRTLGVALALGAMAAGTLSTALAQEVRPRVRVERDDCRCVDRDGNPIENCTCFTMPDVDRIVTRALAGVVARPRLGITLGGADDARGARVEDVMVGGPAEVAGIREGDIITRLAGKSLLEPLGSDIERRLDQDGSLPTQRLMTLIRDIEPGQEVQVEYLRGGERRTATVKARDLEAWTFVAPRAPGWDDAPLRERLEHLGERMGELRLRLPPVPPRLWECPEEEGPGGFVFRADRCPGGLQLVALNPGLASYFRTDSGVLIAAVHEGSRLGLQAGDIVVKVDGRDASHPDQLRRILSSYGADEEISMTVIRQGREVTTRGTLSR